MKIKIIIASIVVFVGFIAFLGIYFFVPLEFKDTLEEDQLIHIIVTESELDENNVMRSHSSNYFFDTSSVEQLGVFEIFDDYTYIRRMIPWPKTSIEIPEREAYIIIQGEEFYMKMDTDGHCNIDGNDVTCANIATLFDEIMAYLDLKEEFKVD